MDVELMRWRGLLSQLALRRVRVRGCQGLGFQSSASADTCFIHPLPWKLEAF